MIDPYSSTAIVILFLIIWAIIIPVVGAIPKIGKIISYRYLVITVFLACMIGVVVNFDGLDSSIKMAVIVGTAIISGVYIILRSIEKWLYNGWTFNKDFSASVSKGDAKAEIKVTDKKGDAQ